MSLDDLVCPACDDTEVDIIREASQNVTWQCTECNHVWTTSPRHLRSKELALVISDGEESTREIITVATTDMVSVEDEFQHSGHRLLITAIESEGRYVKKAQAVDVVVIHAKVFDTVPLKISVNDGDITKSYRMDVLPEREVHIGEVIEIEGMRLAVKTLKSDQNRTLHRGFLFARNIRRVFCDEIKGRRRRFNRVSTRKRGAPPGAKRRKR